jgi:FixJ family two-component response regulator
MRDISELAPKFDPRRDLCQAQLGRGSQSMVPVMPLEANEIAIVHVVDDDPSMRAALEGLFLTIGLATRSYGTAQDFLNSAFTDSLGCIVIDVRLPDINGLDFQAMLTEANVRLPVVMMTGYGDIPMSVRAMKHGAVDFLAKPFRDVDMLDAVAAAIERDRERRRANGTTSTIQERFAKLSHRQQQVMLLVTAGRMNKQVASELGISEITVKIHRRLVMDKMGARTFADLVRMADAVLKTEPP